MRGKGFWAAAAAALAVSGASAAEPVASTETGQVRGLAGDGYVTYLGIPYAAPPVGDLRWAEPKAAPAWTGVRDGTKLGSACVQVVSPGMANPNSTFEEDCLYLNVTAPAAAQAKPLPVMVWIHGGGFSNGEGHDYDARRMATQGKVVMVTINYRLGVFGFLGLPGLEHSGEFGLLDQQAALGWVRRNIKAFGGDAANVTVFGESAGAMSVCAHLVAPSSKGLFDKAILQSGACGQRWAASMIWPDAPAFNQFISPAESQAIGGGAAAKLNCTGAEALACLRRLPAADLLKAGVPGLPAYGGLLPEPPAAAFAAGRFQKVPLIWGWTKDEWRASAGIYDKLTGFTDESYRKFLTAGFADAAAKVEAEYPPAKAGGPAYAWAAVSTDSAWACPTLGQVRAAQGATPVYAYQFADPHAPNPAYDVPADFDLGAAHATELPLLFDLGGVPSKLDDGQQALAMEMIAYWTAFARTGDPNGRGRAAWKPVKGADERMALKLAPGKLAMTDVAAVHHCDFWGTLKAK